MSGGDYPVIAIAGNPNCGKTTLFNAITGSDQRVGNWPGVTVEKKSGHFSFSHVSGEIVDLPGIYSLTPDSEDELAAKRFLSEQSYDLVINVVDASNMERNLYLTMQLREMNIPVILVLNKMDLADSQGFRIDEKELGRLLGVKVLSGSAVDEGDLKKLKTELDRILSLGTYSCRPFKIEYHEAIEQFIRSLEIDLEEHGQLKRIGIRSTGISLLEEDRIVTDMVLDSGLSKQGLAQQIHAAGKAAGDDFDMLIAESRYHAIDMIGQDVKKASQQQTRGSFDLDALVMHRFWGVPIFFAVMYMVFAVTMTIGGVFIDFFDIFFGAVFVDGTTALLATIGSPEWVVTLIAGGVGGGLQTISTFIPVIFFMFLMLGILEDSGYMARAAFVMDRFMRFVGLPGKAFVPMLVGFGCTVPAIMATRTLDSRRDRFLAIFMVPFMSCGARLPVYALFAAAFFQAHSGLVVFSIYAAGILLSVLTGLILKHTLFKGSFSPFIMELPEYHVPQAKKVLRYSWDRLKLFMFRAGKVIIIVVVILTLLGSLGVDGSFGNDAGEQSVLAAIGKTITPVFSPMGISRDNWPATVGLFTGIFAKEAVVGTLSSLYISADAVPDESGAFDPLGSFAEAFQVLWENILGLLSGLLDPFGLGVVGGDELDVASEIEADQGIFTALRARFSPAGAYAYMLFILIYFPCVAALGAVFREAGRFYGVLLASYLTLLAWVVSVLTFQVAEGRSLFWIMTAGVIMVLIYVSLMLLGRREKKMEAAEFL